MTPSTSRKSSQLGLLTRLGVGDGNSTAPIVPDALVAGDSANRLVDSPGPAHGGCHTGCTMASDRFLTLADVAEVLNISASQTYALVRNGDLEAIKIGGRGQWRVEREKLENFIARMYDQTKHFVDAHPFTEADADQLGSS